MNKRALQALMGNSLYKLTQEHAARSDGQLPFHCGENEPLMEAAERRESPQSKAAPIHTIQRTVTELSGRRGKPCYYVLRLAVEAACGYMPEEPRMGAICAMVQARADMSTGAVSKALSRVAADIWDHGNRDKLRQIYGRPVPEPPSPKELVLVLAEYCSR